MQVGNALTTFLFLLVPMISYQRGNGIYIPIDIFLLNSPPKNRVRKKCINSGPRRDGGLSQQYYGQGRCFY